MDDLKLEEVSSVKKLNWLQKYMKILIMVLYLSINHCDMKMFVFCLF